MSDDLRILGYWQAADQSFKPIIHAKGYIYSRAFILCTECRTPISGQGGPMYNSFCVPCYNKLFEDQEKK